MLDERRLAGAVGADEAVDAAARQRQAHRIERGRVAESPGDVRDVNDRIAHRRQVNGYTAQVDPRPAGSKTVVESRPALARRIRLAFTNRETDVTEKFTSCALTSARSGRSW